MKIMTLFNIVKLTACLVTCYAEVFGKETHQVMKCDHENVTQDFKEALYDFSLRVYKASSKRYESHFVISQYSIWLAIAGITEGAVGESKQNIFTALNLPQEKCLREKYYELAANSQRSGRDVTFTRRRILALDVSLNLNSTWAHWVFSKGLLDIGFTSIKNNAKAAADVMNAAINTKYLNTDFSGNSVFLDSLDFSGVWTDDGFIELVKNSTFYNEFSVPIGYVDMFYMKKYLKIAYFPLLDLKCIELPIGIGGRYKLHIGMNTGFTPIQKVIELIPNMTIHNFLENATETMIHVKVAIPRFTMTSQHDNLRPILESIGIDRIWEDPASSKFVSTPPALPSAYSQRLTINISNNGHQENNTKQPFPLDNVDLETDASNESINGRDFIANKPFVFSLIDKYLKTVMFSGVYSRPSTF